MYSKFVRHLFAIHKDEEEIKPILKLKPLCKERRRVVANIRARGARIFNQINLSPSKLIIPRTIKNFKKDEYVPCHLCGNLYKGKYLCRHFSKCPNKTEQTTSSLRTAVSAAYANPGESDETLQFSKDIFAGMAKGIVKNAVGSDETLKSFGRYLCAYYKTEPHLVNLIRRKLRYLAEVLLETQKSDKEIMDMADIFQPKKLQLVFNAIKAVTGYNKGVFKRPAMATDLSPL